MTSKLTKAPTKVAKRVARARDAETTMALIVDTAADLLAEHGFTGFGVNSLSKAAGVDKQLIYYYFGGLDGVIQQLGTRLELWLGAPLQARPGEAYAEATNRLLSEYFAALRRNVLVQRLLAWELMDPPEVLKELEQIRSRAMASWVADFRTAVGPIPEGIDAPAINALLLAGLQYLTLRERSIGSFAGMNIQSEEGIKRINAAVEMIVSRVYGVTLESSK